MAQQDFVDKYRWERRGNLHTNRMIAQLWLQTPQGDAGDIFKRTGFAAKLHGAAFEARHVEKVRDQAGKTVALFDDTVEQFFARFLWDARATCS